MQFKERLRLLIIPAKIIDQTLPHTGIIYEIGSGLGALAGYLAKKRPQQTVIGIDIDKKKISRAQREFQLPNCFFVTADSATYAYKKYAGAILSDFLHHVPFETQKKVLKQLVKHIDKNGTLVIKEIDDAAGWRKWCSRIWDQLRFKASTYSTTGWFPGSTVLYICTKYSTNTK